MIMLNIDGHVEAMICKKLQEVAAAAFEMYNADPSERDYDRSSPTDPDLVCIYRSVLLEIGASAARLVKLLTGLSTLHVLMANNSSDGGADLVLRAVESIPSEDREVLFAERETRQEVGSKFTAFTESLGEALRLLSQLYPASTNETETEFSVPLVAEAVADEGRKE
jgi:hypothetical protein